MDNELKEAFEIAFCFDITKFEEAYSYTHMGCLFDDIGEPRRLKWALDRLSKKFGWGKTFFIYKHGNRGFAVDTETYGEETDVEDIVKVE